MTDYHYFQLYIPESLIVYSELTGQGDPVPCNVDVKRRDGQALAEIGGGVALAGEISPGPAISASDRVSSHEKHGRNR